LALAFDCRPSSPLSTVHGSAPSLRKGKGCSNALDLVTVRSSKVYDQPNAAGHQQSACDPPHINGTLRNAVLIGVDPGANLSVFGSLATILWLIAIRREGQEVSFWRFLKGRTCYAASSGARHYCRSSEPPA